MSNEIIKNGPRYIDVNIDAVRVAGDTDLLALRQRLLRVVCMLDAMLYFGQLFGGRMSPGQPELDWHLSNFVGMRQERGDEVTGDGLRVSIRMYSILIEPPSDWNLEPMWR